MKTGLTSSKFLC